jgi:hypothetical protein
MTVSDKASKLQNNELIDMLQTHKYKATVLPPFKCDCQKPFTGALISSLSFTQSLCKRWATYRFGEAPVMAFEHQHLILHISQMYSQANTPYSLANSARTVSAKSLLQTHFTSAMPENNKSKRFKLISSTVDANNRKQPEHKSQSANAFTPVVPIINPQSHESKATTNITQLMQTITNKVSPVEDYEPVAKVYRKVTIEESLQHTKLNTRQIEESTQARSNNAEQTNELLQSLAEPSLPRIAKSTQQHAQIAAVDVERLATQVVNVIDRRLIARRERKGQF